MTWIWPALGALGGILTAAITVISFWIAFAEKIATAKAIAEGAHAVAEEAKKDAEEVRTQLAAHVGQLSLFREHVAREYVDRDVIENMEKRIMDAFKGLTERLDKVLQHRPGGR